MPLFSGEKLKVTAYKGPDYIPEQTSIVFTWLAIRQRFAILGTKGVMTLRQRHPKLYKLYPLS